MSTNKHTARDALAFIFSSRANFTAGDVIYIDAREASIDATWAEHPQQILINQSSAGRAIGHMIESNLMSDDEKRRILRAATAKFLGSAEQDFELILDKLKPREAFLRFELLAILRNEAILTLNGIPREKLNALHAADPHAEKITALPIIIDSLRERSIVRDPKPETGLEKPDELLLLEKEIDNLVSGKFKELVQHIKVAEGELNRSVLSWNAYVAEREAMSWEKFLPTVRFRLLREKWDKKKDLGIKRRSLDLLQNVQQKEERALITGRYSAHIQATLEGMGVNLAASYGNKCREVIAQAIERSVLKHKAEAERTDISPKEARRPKFKPKL